MRISVTKAHISTGKRNSPHSCPVALAIAAHGFKDVRVYSYYVQATGYPSYILSSRVVDKILSYDMGLGMEPFHFEMNFYEPENTGLSN